jgi:hypothetical protein
MHSHIRSSVKVDNSTKYKYHNFSALCPLPVYFLPATELTRLFLRVLHPVSLVEDSTNAVIDLSKRNYNWF